MLSRSVVSGMPLAKKSMAQPSIPRSSVVVRASSEDTSRRGFLSVVGVGAAILVARGAEAIDIFDDRKVKDTGYNLIYEARDLDLTQNTRDGMDQFKGDLEGTKKRAAVSVARLKKNLPKSIEKSYWVQGREELRLQLGTLRFDLNTIASSFGDRDSRTAAKAANAKFYEEVEVLDAALRAKDQDAAQKAFDKTIAALDILKVG